MKKLLLPLVFASLTGPASADTTNVDTVMQPDTLMRIDTTIYRPGQVLAQYSEVTDPRNFEKQLRQPPTIALFKSLLVPGWGQLGNRRYIKAVVFAGLDAWFIGSAIHYGRQASDFRHEFENATPVADRNQLYDLYLDRKDERNKFRWFAVIVTFISMFDAYVDAHLSGFPHQTEQGGVGLDVR
ncbi:MAG: DUF5683 domain-containing protein, partial [Candidatus Zixiibacteriota bacterium]